MQFRLKNKSYVLNTKIKIVGKNGASLSTISTEINNPTTMYNVSSNTLIFCLAPLPSSLDSIILNFTKLMEQQDSQNTVINFDND